MQHFCLWDLEASLINLVGRNSAVLQAELLGNSVRSAQSDGLQALEVLKTSEG